MAFSYGFFNAKNLDRVYTAESFNDYLSGLICNGVFDTYGDNFSITPGTGVSVVVGTGKAWINGHYFINDTAYTLDLSKYVDESLSRFVTIGISCDVSDSVRACKLEVVTGTAATSPTAPILEDTTTKTYLMLATVKLLAGKTNPIVDTQITDLRDGNRCGYVKCILGKCKVSEILSKLTTYNNTLKEVNERVAELQSRLTEVEEVTSSTGVILVSAGQCGENVFYALYSDGVLKLNGSGATYDYSSDSNSPLYDNQTVKSVVIADGITAVGAYLFEYCDALETVSFPSTITTIGNAAFHPRPDEYVPPTTALGLTELTLPNSVTEIGAYAFAGTRITTLTIPRSVSTVGKYAFDRCIKLQTVRYEGSVIGEFMFVYCTSLTSVTLAKTVKEISSHCFNYCDNLDEITYEGTLENWAAVTKRTNWDGNTGNVGLIGLSRVVCTDGYMAYDRENNEWNEVKS